MNAEMLAGLIQRLRQRPLVSASDLVPCAGTREELEGLLPHRPPFLLLDAVLGFDPGTRTVLGRRRIDPADPVLAGHFPTHPVYPGVLQIEAVSQLGLCLVGLLSEGGIPADGRVILVHHARFVAEVGPGAELTLMAQIIADDTLTATVAGQIYHRDRLCSFAVMEAYLVDA